MIQAAASNYRRLRRETAEDEKPKREAERAEQAAEAARSRERAGRDNGKRVESVRVSPSEAEAVLQKMKHQRTSFAYKASVIQEWRRRGISEVICPQGSTPTRRSSWWMSFGEEVCPDGNTRLVVGRPKRTFHPGNGPLTVVHGSDQWHELQEEEKCERRSTSKES